MKVLVLGSGAREHAITWKFSKSNRISGLFIAPGNAGTEDLGENLPKVDPCDASQVIAACQEHRIDYVFVGPEAPLSAGVVDALSKAGIACFGPHQAAARLESSKEFSKDFMLKYKIPTAKAVTVNTQKELEKQLKGVKKKIVIKKNGLAAGKGVLESDDPKELLEFGTAIIKGKDSLLIEEYLVGYEISVFALTDGKDYVVLPTTADFKKAGEGDTGPNTGGMGAICPVPIVSKQLMEEIDAQILAKTFAGLKKEKLSFKGVLFFGLMITEEGPMLLEYNVRFGDPECQVLMPLIESDFGNLCEAISQEKLAGFPIRISSDSTLGIVVASGGYPGEYKKGVSVKPIPSFPEKDVMVFHAATGTKGGKVVTGGGRCFTVVGKSQSLLNASIKAYESVSQVKFDGAWFRKDIGKKFFLGY